MLRVVVLFMVMLACLAWEPARADDWADCTDAQLPKDGAGRRVIVACTAVIEGKGVEAGRLARAYHQRGLAYLRVKPEWRGWAQADFTKAIRLKSDLAEAYFNRAVSVPW